MSTKQPSLLTRTRCWMKCTIGTLNGSVINTHAAPVDYHWAATCCGWCVPGPLAAGELASSRWRTFFSYSALRRMVSQAPHVAGAAGMLSPALMQLGSTDIWHSRAKLAQTAVGGVQASSGELPHHHRSACPPTGGASWQEDVHQVSQY